ncbi:MAG: hypothetical protein ABIA97_05210 [Candidatus Omnitrophota bacterium]
MKKILPILLCLLVVGCAAVNSSKKVNKVDLEAQIIQLQHSLSEKETSLKQLQNLLQEKDLQLKDKEAKINDLHKRLEMFGVFEK